MNWRSHLPDRPDVRFAANLTWLFGEVPMPDRPAAARAAGFDGVEVLFPYDHAPGVWQQALDGMPVALINTPPGDWAVGGRGHAAVPGAEATFRDGFARALDWAAAMGAQRIHVMAGNARGPEAEATYRANLEWAAGFGVPLTVEPLNVDDMPGYFLNDYNQAARILDDLALPSVGLQFDLWHATRIHGDAGAVWSRHAARTSHIQIAGLAARHEPGGGGFDLTGFCRSLADTGLWVAAEYRPARDTLSGLGWLAALRARDARIGG
jgi:2-dehydrotetronate isomerase